MEYSRIELDKVNWTATETHRVRIPAPGADDSYCEKNWVPILDKPYHFVKWTTPTEIVWANPEEPECKTVTLKDGLTASIVMRPGMSAPRDQRGSSQLVRWGNMYLSITHEVNLYKNYLDQKDAVYRHRLIVWDSDLNIVGISPEEFSFLDAQIEFCAGAAVHNGDLLISFGFQDNAAFVLRVPKSVVEEMIVEAIS